jgi:hypothetical protein
LSEGRAGKPPRRPHHELRRHEQRKPKRHRQRKAR